jgi:hypothetical protein
MLIAILLCCFNGGFIRAELMRQYGSKDMSAKGTTMSYSDIPNYLDLLPNKHIEGTNVRLSRSLEDTSLVWSKTNHQRIRAAAPKILEERDLWDAQIDFLLTNYLTLSETFLHAFLRSKKVKTELILSHTAYHYEKARALVGIYADPRVETVCEIGFNAGHSSLNALLARKGIRVISFDLGEFWDSYGKHSYELLDRSFPNQLVLVLGDSTITVPKFVRDHPELKCNVLFVDGGHTKEIAEADILNMAPLVNSTFHRLVVDDTDFGAVREAWDEAVKHGLIEEDGTVHSHYVSEYLLQQVTDETYDLQIPMLSPGPKSGPANPDILSATGAMSIGSYIHSL